MRAPHLFAAATLLTGSILLPLPAGASPDATAAPAAWLGFEDNTDEAGIRYSGEEWGAAWGDVNSDGWPDLWTPDHTKRPQLWVNNGDGTFTDRAGSLAPETVGEYWDMHGSAWADYDNDGDDDLLQLIGNSQFEDGQILLRNDGGVLVNVAAPSGIEYAAGGGRSPLWIDVDRDGLLDIIVPTLRRLDTEDLPSMVFRQLPDHTFVEANAYVGFTVKDSTHFVLPSRLNLPGREKLLFQSGGYKFPTTILDTTTMPWAPVKKAVGIPTALEGQDAAAGDFNGDGIADLFIVGGPKPNSLTICDEGVTVRLQPRHTEYGIDVESPGPIDVLATPRWLVDKMGGPSHIFLGAAGQPAGAYSFRLDPTDPALAGIAPHTPGVDTGIWIGYDAARGMWMLRQSSASWSKIVYEIRTDVPVGDVVPVGFTDGFEAPNLLYLSQPDGSYVNVAGANGANALKDVVNLAAADFDNDGDLDVYLVRTKGTENLPDAVMLNDGHGVFTVHQSDDLAGPCTGQGGAVAVADYDRDGWLDVAVTEGRTPARGGPTRLLRNLGASGNHWLQVDLVGTESNRDAVGSVVTLTTTLGTQMQEHYNETHERGGQHQDIVHFGLGAAGTVETLTIEWPNGTVQVLHDLGVDQVLRVVEPAAAGT